MRYSTEEEDAGFTAYNELLINEKKTVLVYLNGDEVREVVTVDTDTGYIKKAVEPLHAEEGKVVMEELFGNVTIKFKDWE